MTNQIHAASEENPGFLRKITSLLFHNRLVGIVVLILIAFILTLLSFASPGKKKPENKLAESISPYPTQETGRIDISKTKTRTYTLKGDPDLFYPFDPDPFVKGYKVGEITVYLSNLEGKFSVYFTDTPQNRLNMQYWKETAYLVNYDAILLNEGIKAGIVPTNRREIDYKLVNQARDYLKKNALKNISGEKISLWFYNMEPPKMGVEEAKKKTRAIIEDLRDKIDKGELTMKQAGDTIISMKDLGEIDFSYKANAYTSFQNVPFSHSLFNDPLVNEAIWKLKQGELSQIITARDKDSKGWYDAHFDLIKINSVKNDGFITLDNLVKSKMDEGYKINLL